MWVLTDKITVFVSGSESEHIGPAESTGQFAQLQRWLRIQETQSASLRDLGRFWDSAVLVKPKVLVNRVGDRGRND